MTTAHSQSNNSAERQFAHRRAARFFLAVAILAAPAFLLPTTAGAQDQDEDEEITLISSFGFFGQLNNQPRARYAQGFTTGLAAGYTLSAIELKLGALGTGTWTVSVSADAGTGENSRPGLTDLFDLTNPTTLTANATNTFTAPANTTLTADTTYYVVIEKPTDGRVSVVSAGDSVTRASGWVFPGDGLWMSTSDGMGWEENPLNADRIEIHVTGTVLPVVTVAPGKSPVVGGTGDQAEDAVFTLTRTGGDMSEALTVNITVGGDGALASEITTHTEATFEADSPTAEVSVEASAIAPGGADQAVTLTIGEPGDEEGDDEYTVGASPGNTATVTTTAPLPVVTVAADNPSILGGSANDVAFTLTRSHTEPAADALTVTIAITGNMSATNGARPGTATFEAGMATTQVTISSSSQEAGDSLDVTLTVQDGAGYTPGDTASAIVTVNGPPLPVITVAAAKMTVPASDGNVEFVFTRTGDTGTALTVPFTIMDADGVLASTPRTADVGTRTEHRVSIAIANAPTGQATSDVTLTVTTPGNGYTVGSASMAMVTVTAPTVMPTLPEVTASVSAGGESVVGGEDAVFTLTRSGDTAAALTVNITVSGTGALASEIASKTSATFETTMTTTEVSVQTNAIATGGGDQSVTLTIDASDDSSYTVGASPSATVSTTPPAEAPAPLPEVTASVSAGGESVVGGEDALFTLTRTGDAAAALTVNITVSGAGALASEIAAKTSATFETTMTTTEVSVQTNAITASGDDQSVTLTVDASDDSSYTVGASPSATVSTTPPVEAPAPLPEVTASAKAGGESVVGGEDAVFTLTRSGDAAAELTVNITVSGAGALASEISAKTSATFETTMTTTEVSVQTNSIATGGGDQSVTLTIDASDDSSYTVGASPSATVSTTPPAEAPAPPDPAEPSDPAEPVEPAEPIDAALQERLRETTDHSLGLLAPSVAAGTVQVLTARFESMAAGTQGGASRAASLGGRPLGALASGSGTELAREVAGLFGLRLPASRSAAGAGAPGVPPTETPGAVYATPGAFETQGAAAFMSDAQNLDLGRGANAVDDADDWRAFDMGSLHGPDLRRVLSQSGFSVQLGAAHGAHGGAASGASHWTLWGRGAAGGFDGEEKESALEIDGENVSAYLGTDVQRGDLALGLAVGWSEGELDYAGGADAGSGELETELTSVHPYLHWTDREDMSLYAMLGYGFGDATLDDAGVGASLDSDIEMQMLAVGLRRAIAGSGTGGRAELKMDAFWVDIESDGATLGAVNWAAVDSHSNRLRLALAGAAPLLPEGGAGRLLAEGELAARLDGGDAQTGLGVEIGTGLTWMQGGFSLAARGRVLLVHSEGEFGDYEEWGASLSASYQAGAGGRGLRFSLAPAWGDVQSGVDALYESADALRELGDGGRRGNAARRSIGALPDRLDFELGYGLTMLGGRAELLPFGRFSFAGVGDAETRLRLGTRFDLPFRPGDALAVHSLGFELFNEQRMGDVRDQRVALEVKLGF